MGAYEFLYILSTDHGEEQRNKISERLQASLEKKKAKILSVDQLGLQTFAMELNKQTQGYYTQVHFQIDAAGLKEFQEELKVTEDIFRHIIVKLDSVLPKEEYAQKVSA